MLSKRELATILFIKKQTGSFFYHLPKDVIINHISCINVKNAFHFFFNADYISLINLLQIKPDLMFAQIPVEMNGMEKIYSLAQIALFRLDYQAWDICYQACLSHCNKDQLLKLFYTQAKEVNDCYIDLQPLFDAYEIYIRYFHEFNAGKIDSELLLFYWLAVGRAQRDVLPLPMLMEMCLLDLSLEVATNDLALVWIDDDTYVDELQLDNIANNHHVKNILIKRPNKSRNLGCFSSQYELILYRKTGLDNAKWLWISAPVSDTPYNSVTFPAKPYEAIRYTLADHLLQGKINPTTTYQWGRWRSGNLDMPSWLEGGLFLLTQSGAFLNFQKEMPTFEKISLADVRSQLGISITLARGAGALCFGITEPAGGKGLLGYKAAEDMRIFKMKYLELQEKCKSFVTLLESHACDVSNNIESKPGYSLLPVIRGK